MINLDKEFLNFEEAAQYLGISLEEFRTQVEAGEVDVTNDPLTGRENLVAKTELDELKNFDPYNRTGLRIESAGLTKEEMASVLQAFAEGEKEGAITYSDEEVEQEIAELIASFKEPAA